MAILGRITFVAHGRLAMREIRLEAARRCRHGVQVMTFEQMAARLAGGFLEPIDADALRIAVRQALPVTDLCGLDGIKDLPGMSDAACETLRKIWRSGIDLTARAGDHPRLGSIRRLEEAVVARLPPSMMRPADLAVAAGRRLEHARALFGAIDVVGITELSPVWRPLLAALAEHVTVRWIAGARRAPGWLGGMNVSVVVEDPMSPEIASVSAATAQHEAIEALRWARRLVASGTAAPSEIAIAAVATDDYDDHFQALRADANLDVHFVHGVKAMATREGQAAAALADIVVRGLTQARMRRLSSHLVREAGPFSKLPAGWTRALPEGSPLASAEAWDGLIKRLQATGDPTARDVARGLGPILVHLHAGTAAAFETGEALLRGRTLAIWRKALTSGAAASIERTLDRMRIDDGLEACTPVAVMPAAALAASPRRFVRLLGLSSSRWPRRNGEDRLLSDHIVPTAELDPLPVSTADRRDFETILATTGAVVVLSRSRRDGDGRLLGRSALLQPFINEAYLRRNAVPVHAMSETDRLLARPEEYAATALAVSADACWRDWWCGEVTAHDGLVRPDHPVLLAILERPQSASSLRLLLRNPLGFVWTYGLRWRAPRDAADALILDALEFGNLVHATLDHALHALEDVGGLHAVGPAAIEAAVGDAAATAASLWAAERAIPPKVIWTRTVDEAGALSGYALGHGVGTGAGSKSYGEVRFGGAGTKEKAGARAPWDGEAGVVIPGAGFRISGYIDRLDLSPDGGTAIVRDYKTGQAPKKAVVLDGGRELQRCLYGFAVKALLGDSVSISASLLYLREGLERRLEDPEATLAEASRHLAAARVSLAAGHALGGPDAAGAYDDLAFAMPANAGATYCERKAAAVAERLADAAAVWEAT